MNTTKAKEFAIESLSKWGLLQKGWKFSFNRALSYAGICYEVEKEIRISRAICEIESDDFIKDTILHEIAHALAGTKHGHGKVWQAWARKVGASPAATYVESEKLEKYTLSKSKYVMCYEDKIVKAYLRKPNKKTITGIKNYFVPGRMEETIGKLAIEVYNSSIHKEYV